MYFLMKYYLKLSLALSLSYQKIMGLKPHLLRRIIFGRSFKLLPKITFALCPFDGFLNFTPSALAQLTPDNTLGIDNSVMTPNQLINGINTDLIQGGAINDINLFIATSGNNN